MCELLPSDGDTVKSLQELRLSADDFEVKTVIGRGHFGEVRVSFVGCATSFPCSYSFCSALYRMAGLFHTGKFLANVLWFTKISVTRAYTCDF